MCSWKRLSLRLRRLRRGAGLGLSPTIAPFRARRRFRRDASGDGACDPNCCLISAVARPGRSAKRAALPSREPITLRLARLKRVVGIEIDADQVAHGLLALARRLSVRMIASS